MVITDVRDLTALVALWADNVYPSRTPEDTLVKLLEEVAELFKTPGDPGELADVAILVLDLFYLHKIPIGKAVFDKMQINKVREWRIDPKTGIMSHIPE